MYSHLPVKQVNRIHLLKKIQKTAKEMLYLDHQIRRADLEIETLENKLEVGAWSQMLIMLTIGTLTKLAFVFVGNKEDQMKCVLCLYLTAVVMMMVT